MNFLVIDGNSILNRAFYGIKVLTTKDGRFTNAIYGFMNIFLRLKDECQPQAVAVAFDVKQPTFRHEMYGGYKATRKGMPDELAQQMPVLKELLEAMGVPIVEKPGYEADDILGTLSRHSGDAVCTIATGDRDSLQLVSDSVNVLLAATKMGRPVTDRYTPEAVREKYGVEPIKLIDIKALMGDSSDNIPGVAGIGEKTAGDLIARFGSIEYIYDNIDTIDIKPGVRDKLKKDRDMAFLSKKLGTINCDIPIDNNPQSYILRVPDNFKVTRMLADLEMFKLIDRLGLEISNTASEPQKEEKPVPVCAEDDFGQLMTRLKSDGESYFLWDGEKCRFDLGDKVLVCDCENENFYPFFIKLLEDKNIKKYTADIKSLYSFAQGCSAQCRNMCGDLELEGYVLNPSASSYDALRLAGEYSAAVPVENGDENDCAAASLRRLFAAMDKKIEENGQQKLLHDIELPLAHVLSSMEQTGFAVDRDGIAEFGKQLSERIAEIEQEIYALVGYEFNLNSPKQLGEALFEKLKLPARKKTKSGYSTDAQVLESLENKHPAVRDILTEPMAAVFMRRTENRDTFSACEETAARGILVNPHREQRYDRAAAFGYLIGHALSHLESVGACLSCADNGNSRVRIHVRQSAFDVQHRRWVGNISQSDGVARVIKRDNIYALLVAGGKDSVNAAQVTLFKLLCVAVGYPRNTGILALRREKRLLCVTIVLNKQLSGAGAYTRLT